MFLLAGTWSVQVCVHVHVHTNRHETHTVDTTVVGKEKETKDYRELGRTTEL